MCEARLKLELKTDLEFKIWNKRSQKGIKRLGLRFLEILNPNLSSDFVSETRFKLEL